MMPVAPVMATLETVGATVSTMTSVVAKFQSVALLMPAQALPAVSVMAVLAISTW